MKLSDEQAIFTADLAALVLYANSLDGCAVVLKEVYRPPETAAHYAMEKRGIVNSLHCQSLAADVALFRNGIYQEESEAYEALGAWWEARRPGNRWGGGFTRPDGNHFERRIFGTIDGGRART